MALASASEILCPASPNILRMPGIIFNPKTSKAACGTAARAALPRLVSAKLFPVSTWRDKFDPVNCARLANPAPPAAVAWPTVPKPKASKRAEPPATTGAAAAASGNTIAPNPRAAGAIMYGAEPPANSPNFVPNASSQPLSVGLNVLFWYSFSSLFISSARSGVINPVLPARFAMSALSCDALALNAGVNPDCGCSFLVGSRPNISGKYVDASRIASA